MTAEPGTSARAPVIAIERLSRVYALGRMTVPALREIDLVIRAGEYVAIMGPSGSGKSTLMNILGCLDRPTAGSYRLGGVDVSTLDDDALSRLRNREIGFVFQTFNLLARATAVQNVELPLIYAGVPPAERRRRAEHALGRVGLEARAGHKPNELSGGEGQRVAIARAIVTEPAMVLADEPTGNLDSQTGEEVMATFDRIWASGSTVILVTHEEDVAGHSDRILRLRDGRIASDQAVAVPRRAHG